MDQSKLTAPVGSIETSSMDVNMEKRRIKKNVLLIGIAFFFNFLSFEGLHRLQSSLHKDEGIGVISTGVLYLVLTFTCPIIPSPLIAKIGHKWTMVVSFMFYIIWMAANGYAVWGTMVPAATLLGLAAGPLWTAQSSYLSLLAPRYATLSNDKAENVLPRFFGVDFFFFTLAGVVTSAISSTVLSTQPPNVTTEATDYGMCGFNDCPYYNITNIKLEQPPKSLVWILVGIYIAIACCGILITSAFVDKIPQDLIKKRPTSLRNTCGLVLVTLKLFQEKEMLLLIPMTAHSGVAYALFNAEFTKSFVSCTIGIWMIGYFTLPYCIVNVISVVSSSVLTKYTGRIPLVTLAAVVELGAYLVMIFLEPNQDNAWVLLVLAGVFGFSAGIWRLHYSLFGIIFSSQTDAAFSARSALGSFGSMIAYMYSNFLCTSTKLFIVISLLIASYVGYITVEIMHRRKCKNKILNDLAELDTTIALTHGKET